LKRVEALKMDFRGVGNRSGGSKDMLKLFDYKP
jgi:hypothetical protein